MATEIHTLLLEDVHYIGFPSTVTLHLIASLNTKMEEWAGLDVKFHVLDLAQVADVPTEFFAAVSRFSDRLKGAEGRLISINMQEPLANKVKVAGLESVFNRIHNYPKDLYPQKDLAFSEVETELLRCLNRALREVGERSLRMNFSPSAAEAVPWAAASCVTALSAAAKSGIFTVRLIFPDEVLLKLTSAMMGSEVATGDPLIEGTALELLNLIYGRAQSEFNNRHGPVLAAGTPKRLQVEKCREVSLTLKIATDVGSFYLQIESQENPIE